MKTIRMKWQHAAMAAVVGCVLSAARAAPVLTLQTSCFNSVTISADPGLTNTVAAMANAPEHLTFMASDTMALVQGTRCDRSQDLTLRVRPGTDIVIPDGGSADYAISGIGGNLTATLGGGNLKDDSVATLSLRLNSYGDAEIGSVTGDLQVESSASGDIRIGNVSHARAASIALRGSGDFSAGGVYDAVSATTDGSGNIVLNGTAGTARLVSRGSGDISLDRVTGVLSRISEGAGSVVVGSTSGARISDDGSGISMPPVPPAPPAPAAAPSFSGYNGSVSVTPGGIVVPGVVSVTPGGIVVPGVVSITPGGIVVMGGGSHGHGVMRTIATIVVVGIVLTLLLLLTLAVLPVIWRLRGRPVMRTMPPGEDARVTRLSDDLSGLEPRLARLEQYVTSQDFDLRRQLRALER